jgi:hypothetical protein
LIKEEGKRLVEKQLEGRRKVRRPKFGRLKVVGNNSRELKMKRRRKELHKRDESETVVKKAKVLRGS